MTTELVDVPGMKISLAEREAQLMKVLWDRGPSTVNEVQGCLADARGRGIA
jgi:predicted transcriptional regulator